MRTIDHDPDPKHEIDLPKSEWRRHLPFRRSATRKGISMFMGLVFVIAGAAAFIWLLSLPSAGGVFWMSAIATFAMGCAILWEDLTGSY